MALSKHLGHIAPLTAQNQKHNIMLVFIGTSSTCKIHITSQWNKRLLTYTHNLIDKHLFSQAPGMELLNQTYYDPGKLQTRNSAAVSTVWNRVSSGNSMVENKTVWWKSLREDNCTNYKKVYDNQNDFHFRSQTMMQFDTNSASYTTSNFCNQFHDKVAEIEATFKCHCHSQQITYEF